MRVGHLCPQQVPVSVRASKQGVGPRDPGHGANGRATRSYKCLPSSRECLYQHRPESKLALGRATNCARSAVEWIKSTAQSCLLYTNAPLQCPAVYGDRQNGRKRVSVRMSRAYKKFGRQPRPAVTVRTAAAWPAQCIAAQLQSSPLLIIAMSRNMYTPKAGAQWPCIGQCVPKHTTSR